MILFYNLVYVYVCKTSDEKFGGCWRSFSWLGGTVHVIDIVDTSRCRVCLWTGCLFPSDEESENPCYYLRSFVCAKSQRHPTELPRSSTTTAYQWRRVSYVTVFLKWRFP